jgi:type VII secretion-associated serine protease mycosin
MPATKTEELSQTARSRHRLARYALAAFTTAAVVVGAAAPAFASEEDTATDGLWAVVRSTGGDVEVVTGQDALNAAYDDVLNRSDADVLSIESEDAPVQALGTNDPLRSQQWALDKTSFESAWSTTRGSGIKVAVVDTGVRGDHEDLASVLLSGVDLVSDAGDGRVDPHGHGTHVAGIIAAQANNGRGVAGAAPDVRILPVRVLDQNGSGLSSDVAAGIIWAADQGARVINLSLGGTSPSSGQQDAIRYAVSKGAVVLAAAGNGAQTGNAPSYPGAFPESIAVGAVDSNKARASFSNHGSYVDLAAPGVGILSTYGTGAAAYANSSGTSMATPYASAAAALVTAANPAQTAAQVRAALEGGADDIGGPGRDNEYGFGLIDPRDSVNRALPSTGGNQGAGYWVVGRDGRVQAFGAAPHFGDLAGIGLSAPIVASAPTPSGHGYWLVGADGAVYSFGDARFHGSMGGVRLNGKIVGMAATPTGGGYVLLGSDGGIFTFGDAQFFGSTGGMRLNAPILDLTLSPSGRGYWFVGLDGGVFSFGDAPFRGSTGGMKLAAPVVSMTGGGSGYWMIARDGGVFAFNVPFHGSLPSLKAQYGLPSVPAGLRVRALPGGSGYYILGEDGAVFALGSAKFHGSASGIAPVDLMLLP